MQNLQKTFTKQDLMKVKKQLWDLSDRFNYLCKKLGYQYHPIHRYNCHEEDWVTISKDNKEYKFTCLQAVLNYLEEQNNEKY